MSHPFGTWREELERRGFTKASTGGRQGIYMLERGGIVTKAIGAMVHRHRPNEFSVTFHIIMPLRCAEPPYDLVVLGGVLAPGGVKTEGLLSHLDPGADHWWRTDRLQEAWLLTEQDGLAWLERFSGPDVLIEYFEAEFASETSLERRPAEESPVRRFTRVLTGRKASRQKRPYHQYLLWLAMLYEAIGNMQCARDRLEAYASMAPMVGDEPERIERHRRALADARPAGDSST